MAAAVALSHLADALGRTLPDRGAATTALRGHARAALDAKLDWPTSREEAWRYTPVRGLTEHIWRAPPEASNGESTWPTEIAALPEPRLVFVDGRMAPALSRLPDATDGIWVGSLAAACRAQLPWLATALKAQGLHNEHGLAALNTAALDDGAAVYLPKNTRLQAPLHVVYLQSGAHAAATVTQPHTLVVAEHQAEATVWEHFVGAGQGRTWTNALCTLHVARDAIVRHVTLQEEAAGAQHTGSLVAHLQHGARLEAFTLSLGGASARREMHVHLDGPGAQAQLAGLYLAEASQHHDFQVNVHHNQPHTDSQQNFRSILRDHATGVFSGTVYVAPGALKTNARQLSRSLLLSAQAHVHAQPRLEILADDVKCAHGATIGQLDDEALFYLQSRGLDALRARRLLTYAFAADVLEDAPVAARAALTQRIRAYMDLTDLGDCT
jgi:Fe-S cluster assembly protein SufD